MTKIFDDEIIFLAKEIEWKIKYTEKIKKRLKELTDMKNSINKEDKNDRKTI